MMRVWLVALCVVGAVADVLVTTRIFQDSTCSNEIFSQQSQRLNFVSCALFEATLGDCQQGQCCERNGISSIIQCEQLQDNGDICAPLEVASIGACRLSTICLDQTPNVACCSSLILWDTACSDTSAIKPSGLSGLFCGYKPESARQYFDEKCGDFASGCPAVSTVVTSLCLDSNNCPSESPSRECCAAIDALSFVGSSCTLPGVSCNQGVVSVPHLRDVCQRNTRPSPTPVASRDPGVGVREASVRSCSFSWHSSDSCQGPPDSTDCFPVTGFASCADFVAAEVERFADEVQVVGATCEEQGCCRLTDSSSTMFICADTHNAANLLGLSFVLLLPLLVASVLF